MTWFPSTGWLELLVRTAADHNATAARPLVLQRFGTDVHLTIHESGGDWKSSWVPVADH